jgi:nitrite reductase (NO-forming)/hydroxylamine reductase
MKKYQPAKGFLPVFLSIFAIALAAACGGGDAPEAADTTVAAATDAHPGQTIFETKCVACHTIGEGVRIGPDLKDISDKRERDWLVRWIDDPIGMAQNDPIGQEIFAEYNQVPMAPSFLTEPEIDDVLDYIDEVSTGALTLVTADQGPIELSEAEFDQGRQIFFDRCAGCHGTLRAGATGPNIQPERTTQIGTMALTATLRHGLPGGMPAWGDAGILSEEEIGIMARYVQLPPPNPPARPLAQIRDSWNLTVPVADRPTEPQTDRNWENFFGVILRDAGQVAIIDGDSYELVGIVQTGFAVHILRSSSSGRYYYAVGRDGRVSLIDLWTPEPSLVAQAQGCTDARSVDGSKYEGFEDRYVIQGCYWPPQYVVFDGLTLEPLNVTSVLGNAVDTNEPLDEVRVAAIVASHNDPVWVMGLKESGHVGIVDYSQEGFPLTAKIPAERFLHDGGFDHTKRYFMIAANNRNKMVVVDLENQELVTTFETGHRPHPGRGANWQDPEYGWVNGTIHIGQGLLSVYGADPEARPDVAWQVVREVELDGTGSLFLKTHENSPWVWMDMPMNNSPEGTRQVCVYSKADGDIERCWLVSDHGAAVHFEYNRAGDEVWVSVWDRAGEIVIYDDATLEEKHRIIADWLVTPTGKFNVYNTAHDVY